MLWLSHPQAFLLTAPSCSALPCPTGPSPSVPTTLGGMLSASPLCSSTGHGGSSQHFTFISLALIRRIRVKWWIRGAHCVLSILNPHILKKSWKCVFIYFKGISVLICPWAVYSQGSEVCSRRRTDVLAVSLCAAVVVLVTLVFSFVQRHAGRHRLQPCRSPWCQSSTTFPTGPNGCSLYVSSPSHALTREVQEYSML